MSSLLKKYPIYTGAPAIPGDPGTPATPDSSYVVCRTYTPVQLVRDPITGAYTFHNGAPVTVCETRVVPGTPGTPPTPGTEPDIVVKFSLGWNAGANSIDVLSGEGRYKFTVPAGIGVITGLTASSESNEYKEIDYALSFNRNRVYIVENGVQMTGAFIYSPSDVFSVQRVGITVTYWQNTTLLYTSTVPSYGTLLADSSLYAVDDRIYDPAFATASLGGRGGSAYVSFEPLEALSSRPGYGTSTKSFEKLTTSMTVRKLQGSAASFKPLISLSSNKAYADSRGEFASLTTVVHTDWFVPNSALSAASFVPMLAAGFMLTGQKTVAPGNVNFKPLKTLATNKPYADSQAEFAPLETLALPPFSLVGWADLLFTNSFTMRSTGGEIAPNAFYGTMPMSMSAYSGGQVQVAMSSPLMVSTATGTVVGRAYLEPGAFALTASGTVGSIGEATIGIDDAFTMRAYSGAVVSLELQDGFTIEADVNSGTVGRVRYRLPLFELVASGTVNGLNSAYLTMPMLQPVPSGIARMGLAGFSMVAVGSAIVVLDNDDYEAYVVNLADHKLRAPNEEIIREVTRYTNYPFEQIVRWNGSYYGVASDGLYLLEGPDDDGTPIAWDFHTCDTDFRTHNHKTVGSVYASGRVAEGFTVKVVADKRTTYTYTYETPRDVFPQNHRQKFGKGLKATYYSFQFSDSRSFRLNNAEFEVFNLKRAV